MFQCFKLGLSENWIRKKEKKLELLVHWITKSLFLNVLLLSLYLSFSRIAFFFLLIMTHYTIYFCSGA